MPFLNPELNGKMWLFVSNLFSASQYIPHGHCYLWQTPLVTLHVVSNALIAIAYFSIPVLLIYFVIRRRDVPFLAIFALFGAFIILCGIGHLFNILTLWYPVYWVSGLEHALTALVSCITALQMVTLLPQFLSLKTPAQLEAVNQKLQQEIIERQRTEAERNRAYEELEFRVQERTADLEQERERLKTILDNLSDGIVACDETGTLMLFNHATRNFHGLPSVPLPADQWANHFDLYLSDGITPMSTEDVPLFRAFQGEVVRDVEMMIAPKHGQTRTLLANGQAFFDATGKKLGAVVAMHDITDRKQAEAERKQAEQARERLLAILEATTDMVAMSDTTKQILYMNRAGRTLLGLPLDQPFGDRKLTQNYPAWVNEILLNQAIPEAMRSGIWMGETALLGANGNEIPLSQMILSHKNANGEVEYLSTIARDISAQKQAEAAIQTALQDAEHQAHLLRTVLDSTQDWVFAKDKNFRYILVNRSYAEALEQSIDAMLGKDDLELGFSEELVFGNPEKGIRGFRTDDQTAFAGQPNRNPYDPSTVADGSLRILDTRKTPLYDSEGTIFSVLGVCRDVTERHYAEEALRRSETQLQEKAVELEQTLRELRQTQTQMIQAEKMSGLGHLVAGIAHEINNPVNFIHGNLTPAWEYTRDLLDLIELYQCQIPNPTQAIQTLIEEVDLEFIKEDLPKLMSSMKVGTNRIREIVLSLRNFSRLDEAEMKTVDLHEGIDSTLVILGNRLKGKSRQFAIAVVKQYGSLPLIECYPGQLNQVFMNILSNAIEALEESFTLSSALSPDGTPHTIDLQGKLAIPTITIWTQALSAQQVQIRISNNGAGITQEVQQKMFDPFFTTKPIGKGTGMGLAICYQIIVEKHQGRIKVDSSLEHGTELVICLPVKFPGTR